MIEAQGLTGTWSWVFATGEQAWSSGLYDILGIEPGSVRPDYALMRDLAHPDDRASFAKPADILRTGVLGEHTVRIVRRDGTMRALSIRGEVSSTPPTAGPWGRSAWCSTSPTASASAGRR